MNVRAVAICCALTPWLALASAAQDPTRPVPPKKATAPLRPKPAPAPVAKTIPAPEAHWVEAPGVHLIDWERSEQSRRAAEEARFDAQEQREQQRLQVEQQREQQRILIEEQRERQRFQVEEQRELQRMQVEQQREMQRDLIEQQRLLGRTIPGAQAPIAWEAPSPMRYELKGVLAPWAPGDQADSLYRRARELLNAGEYRRAAAAFRDITSRTPNSAYAAEALYYQAFSLYRMGGTEELRSALDALETQRSRYPGARTNAESDALAIRIRGALASRGDAPSAAIVRTAAGDSALRCDREEQAVRVEALNALTQSDLDGAMPVLQRILGRKDECSVMLRRNAVFLLGSKRRDASTAATLTQVAHNDPSVEVRTSAMEWLARLPGEEALPMLEELSKDSDERVQRAAVRALVTHASPRARTLVRSIVERAETPERLRLEALSAFDKERSTSEDVTWMRSLYGRTENPKIKSRIVSTLSNIGGPEVDQWMLTIARNPDESSETRRWAIRRVGRTLAIADLAKLYDASAERPIRESLIETLASRAEAEATDKLIDIVKTGTDPQLRRTAISALTRKGAKDPRTLRLLMEIIDK